MYLGSSYVMADGTAVADLWDTWLAAAKEQFDIADPKARANAEGFKQLPEEAPHEAGQRYSQIIKRLLKTDACDKDTARWFLVGLHDKAMVHWVNQQFMARNAPDWTFKAVLEFANLYYMRNQLSPLSVGAGVAKSGARSGLARWQPMQPGAHWELSSPPSPARTWQSCIS